MFSKRLKRILRGAMRLSGKRKTLEITKYERLRQTIENRLTSLIADEWKNVEAKRLVKRSKRRCEELLVFLYHEDVPFDNNHAERTIRKRRGHAKKTLIATAVITVPKYYDKSQTSSYLSRRGRTWYIPFRRQATESKDRPMIERANFWRNNDVSTRPFFLSQFVTSFRRRITFRRKFV